jgi:putative NADH-flavin reductase
MWARSPDRTLVFERGNHAGALMRGAHMKVLIVGATGKTGAFLLEQAAAAGHTVTALARDPARVSGVAVVQGDVYDPTSLARAVAGQDAVLAALTPRGNPLAPVDLYSRGGENLVRAMERAGVKRLVFVTSAAVEKGDPALPWWMRFALMPVLHHVYDDARRFEALVRESKLEWTVVRPPRLIDGPRTSRYRVTPRFMPEGPATLSRADLAEFMVAQLADRTFVGGTPTLAD